MAFCDSCGSPVDGAFCPKCGKKFDAPAVPNAAAPSSIPPIPPASPASRKSPLLWILGGCLGLVIIAGITMISTGVFVAKKAGLDPGLMKKNPGLAVAKIVASANPDIEVLSVDEDRGIMRVRDKKTGKALTMDLKDAEKGTIVFLDDQGQKVELRTRGKGDSASMEIQSSEGSMHIGAGAAGQLPAWLPAYPGAQSAGAFSYSAEKNDTGSCAFKTGDSIEKVASFYEDALQSAGFEIQKNLMQAPGQGSMIHLSATQADANRAAHVTINRTGQDTIISLVFETKQ